MPVQPTSDAQFEAHSLGAVPPVEQVAEGIWAVATALPFGHIPYTLSYLIRSSGAGVHLVDPGWNSDDNWVTLTNALRAMDATPNDLASVTVTHLHPDHVGLAERVRAETGAPVAVHRLEQAAMDAFASSAAIADEGQLERWGVPDDRRPELRALAAASSELRVVTADVLLDDGDRLDVADRDLRVIHTPGHTNGHICLVDTDVVLTGDHVLPTIYPGLGLGGATEGNPIADYFASLARVRGFDDREVLPGHSYSFRGLAERCDAIEAHHRRRSSEVAEAAGGASVWEIAASLTWTAGWANLHGFYVQSALAQTAMHVEYLRA